MTDITLFHDLHGFWLWIALGAALLAVEVMSGSGWLLWPAASAAVVALLVRFVGLGLEGAVLSFTVLTIVTTLLARLFLPQSWGGRAKPDINDTTARLVGHHGKAVGAFAGGSGRVFIDGKEWAAELVEGEALEAGARVEVTGVAGAGLKVRGV